MNLQHCVHDAATRMNLNQGSVLDFVAPDVLIADEMRMKMWVSWMIELMRMMKRRRRENRDLKMMIMREALALLDTWSRTRIPSGNP